MPDILISLLRTCTLFFIVLGLFRFLGKKELVKLSLLDVTVSLMIAELAVVTIEDIHIPLLKGIAPVFIIILLYYALTTLSLKSEKIRHLIDGSPKIIIENGKMIQKVMKMNGYDIDDIMYQLRSKEIFDIRDVKFAVLERSGDLSVYKNDINYAQFSLPLIQDGIVQDINLRIVGKTREWLITELQGKKLNRIQDIFYCSYQDGEFHIEIKEGIKKFQA